MFYVGCAVYNKIRGTKIKKNMVDDVSSENLPKRDASHTMTTSRRDSKRSKREWLVYRGERHTRVGGDYQVAVLPTPAGSSKPEKPEKKPEQKQQDDNNVSN